MATEKTIVLWMLLMVLRLLPYGDSSTMFTIVNQCGFTIWPAYWTHFGGGGGTQLEPGQQWTIATYPAWSGRIWARTGCQFGAFGQGYCSTGDCGGFVCSSGGGHGSSLFEITLDAASNLDFYDLSVIEGFNVGIKAMPATSSCSPLSCLDIAGNCPDAAYSPLATNIKTCPYGGDYTLYFCAH